MGNANLLELAAVGAVAFLGMAVLFAIPLRYRQLVLAYAVGASAGLVGVQVLRIHVFTLLVVLWLLLAARQSDKEGAGSAVVLGACSLVLGGTALMGDLVNSPTLALQLIGLTASAIIIILGTVKVDRDRMLVGLLAVVSLASLVGLSQVTGIIPMDLWHLDVSSIGRPTGIYPEPDWLGMFAGIGVILAWLIPMPWGLRSALLVLNVSALVLAFARAAWVAVVVAAVLGAIVFLLRGRSKPSERVRTGRAIAVVVVAVVGAIAFSVNTALRNDVIVRVGTMMGTNPDPDDISGQARVRQTNLLLDLASDIPPWGHGLSASGRVGVWGDFVTGESTNNVASNWLLAMWVDGAFLALPLILFLAWACIRGTRSIAGMALIVTLVSSLFSNATYFPITWMLLAITVAGFNAKQVEAIQVLPMSKGALARS
ncbi:O-antigen ligase family protein [uncultured Microbacterium sp.]|uniref:O-antigen ligase family protein n=1 Tax=uncultured Microbacterium sp. TaxID=191216 RepID=UPI0028D7D407|nr:O-antigen ligase family protein [uncultured Microbacterium sp.]